MIIIVIIIVTIMRSGFVIPRHNKRQDLEAEVLNMVCKDLGTEPVLQDVEGEQLTQGSNKAQDTRLDIHARGFWEPQRSAFFDVRVCHMNAESHRNLELQQIYHLKENEKKRQYSSRALDIQHGTFTPLILTITGGMGKECLSYIVPRQTIRVDCYQERRGLHQNNLMDTSKNLLCTSEIRIKLS